MIAWFGMILATPFNLATARLADMAFFRVFGVSTICLSGSCV
jgi:hypothetical protein